LPICQDVFSVPGSNLALEDDPIPDEDIPDPDKENPSPDARPKKKTAMQ
jgi:hypothetical protein